VLESFRCLPLSEDWVRYHLFARLWTHKPSFRPALRDCSTSVRITCAPTPPPPLRLTRTATRAMFSFFRPVSGNDPTPSHRRTRSTPPRHRSSEGRKRKPPDRRSPVLWKRCPCCASITRLDCWVFSCQFLNCFTEHHKLMLVTKRRTMRSWARRHFCTLCCRRNRLRRESRLSISFDTKFEDASLSSSKWH